MNRDESSTEAARLRYELARLRDRRSVRAALALGELRRAGLRPALAALRGRAPRLDVPGPARVPRRVPYPHLRALYTGAGGLVASTCAAEQVTPDTGATLLRRDRPDLLVVDGTDGWTPAALSGLRAAARDTGTAVVAVGRDAAAAVADADLTVAVGGDVAGADLDLDGSVDVRVWSPAGLDDAGPARVGEGPTGVTPGDARQQPVVVVATPDDATRPRCLELLAAGALVVTGPDRRLEVALGPLADLVVGDAATVAERAEALAAAPDRARRSVRLRRHVHHRLSTRRALVEIVTALGIDDAPDERVSVLLPSRRPDRVVHVLEDLAAQSHGDVEVVLLAHGDAPLPDRLPGSPRVERVGAQRPLGAVLNVGLDLATGAYVGKVDDDDRYGHDHLLDQLLALHHSGADLAGKRIHGVYHEDRDVTVHPPPGGEERWEDHLPGGTLLLPADVLRAVRWRHVPRAVDTELVRSVHLAGGSAYSTHRYGYVRVRHGDHTYDPEVDWAGEERPGLDPSLLEA